MFAKENFIFDHVEEAKGMVGILFVIFSKDEDIIAIKRQFMFNFDFITPTNDKLKSILACMVRGM